MKKLLLAATLLSWPAGWALAQTPPAPNQDWQTVFFDSPTVALPIITQAVLRHSAQLRGLELAKQVNQQDIKLAKKNVLSGVVAGATYSYGNLGAVGTASATAPVLVNAPYNSSRYSVGPSVAISLGQLVSRHTLITREQLTLERSETARQERENEIRQTVIQLYQSVVLARKLLSLQQDAYVSTQSIYKLTEKQFRQGQVALPEFSAAGFQLNSAAIAQETARNQYETAFMLLEEAAGAKISTLMTSR